MSTPITLSVPRAAVVAAEVRRPPGFDATDEVPVVLWIGEFLELVVPYAVADQIADALVDALATDDERRPLLWPNLSHVPR